MPAVECTTNQHNNKISIDLSLESACEKDYSSELKKGGPAGELGRLVHTWGEAPTACCDMRAVGVLILQATKHHKTNTEDDRRSCNKGCGNYAQANGDQGHDPSTGRSSS